MHTADDGPRFEDVAVRDPRISAAVRPAVLAEHVARLGVRVEAVVLPRPDRATFQSVPVIAEADIPAAAARVVVLCAEPGEVRETEARLVGIACPDKIVLLPEEVEGIVNPLVRGKAEG